MENCSGSLRDPPGTFPEPCQASKMTKNHESHLAESTNFFVFCKLASKAIRDAQIAEKVKKSHSKKITNFFVKKSHTSERSYWCKKFQVDGKRCVWKQGFMKRCE